MNQRPDEETNPVSTSFPSGSGSAPTIDPAVPSSEPITATDLPERLGRFAIRGFLGAGAFGTVYRAYDPQLERDVALKVAPVVGQSPERVHRFRREARAAAGLRHPHIVPLFEAGEVEGHLYLATAYVPGRTLEEALAQQDNRPLPPEQAAVVVRKLADALAYAHGQGVLHRDVKSANVMLDPAGEPHLLDFGLARRAEDQERMTVAGAVLGTAAYLSPEAAKGDQGRWTPAADQYALGVVLYELLTGHTPFTGPIELVLALHQTQEAERPSRHNRAVPPDLDAICLKCLEKDPAQRYASAAYLAADLDRFLRGEPVLARRQTFRYLASKFVRRYRRPLAAAGLVAAVLVAGTAAAFLQIRKERNDAVEARTNEGKEKEKAQTALADLTKSRQEAQVVWDVVEQAYSSVQEDTIRHIDGLSPVHEELASIRLEGMKKLAERSPEDGSLEPKLARAHAILGLVSTRVGSFQRARGNLEKAVGLYAELSKREPASIEWLVLHCQALNDLGYLYWEVLDRKTARQYEEQALALLEPAVKQSPSNPAVRFEAARSLVLLASARRDDPGQREKLAERAVRLLGPLLQEKYREVDVRAHLAVATYHITFARFDGKNHQGLLQSLDRIEEMDQAALKLKPNSPYLNGFGIFTPIDRADALSDLGKYKEAAAQNEIAVARARATVEKAPYVVRSTGLLQHALYHQGWAYWRLSRPADVQASFAEATQLAETLIGRYPDRPDVASDWFRYRNQLADFLHYGPTPQGEIQARQDLLRTLDVTIHRGREMARRFPDDIELQRSFALALVARGQYDNVAQRYEQALPCLLEAVEVTHGCMLRSKDNPQKSDFKTYLSYLRTASDCATSVGKRDEATRVRQLANEVRKRWPDLDSESDRGAILMRTAKSLRDQGKLAQAMDAYKQAIALRSSALEKASWNWYLRMGLGDSYLRLADAYREMKDHSNEIVNYRAYLKAVLGPVYGARIDPWLKPARPMNEKEADELLAFIKDRKKNVKRFIVPCDFNGIKKPFPIYITESPMLRPYKHPLQDQREWLWNERRGNIPIPILDSFERLHKIARENNVSFPDLCVYAVGTAAKEGGTTFQVEKVDEAPTAANFVEPPVKEVSDRLAPLKARLVDRKTLLDRKPQDLKLAAEVAGLYGELGQRLLESKQHREARDALRDAVRLHELIVRTAPLNPGLRRSLAAAYLSLAQTQIQFKDFDAALALYHRRRDLLEQFQAEAPSEANVVALADCYIQFGQLAEQRGDKAEAVRCYARALDKNGKSAPNKIANLLQLSPQFAILLPLEYLEPYLRRKERGKPMAGPEFIKEFVADIEAVVKRKPELAKQEKEAELAELSKLYDGLAQGYQKQKMHREALAAFQKVAGLLSKRAALGKADTLSKERARVAFEIGRLAIALGNPEDAIKSLSEAQEFGSEEAVFAIADLYEQGKGMPKDVAKANKIRSTFTFDKGAQLYQKKQYTLALGEFQRSAAWSPSLEAYRRAGMCQMRLDRPALAIPSFKQAIDQARDFREACWVVVDLLEVMTCAGRHDDVLAYLEQMKKKNWQAKETPNPFSVEAYLTAFEAIALLQTGKDASRSQKYLEALLSRPNFRVTRPTSTELDEWPVTAKLPPERAKVVKAIIRSIDSCPSRSPYAPYYPLGATSLGRRPGAVWIYKSSTGGQTRVQVSGRRLSGERESYQLEMTVGGKLVATDRISVEEDGVYCEARGTTTWNPPLRLLPLSPKEKDKWTIKSGDGDIGEATVQLVDVAVPAGKYTKAVLVETKLRKGREVTTTKVWYAKGVGPVRIITSVAGKETTTLELEKYTPPARVIREEGE